MDFLQRLSSGPLLCDGGYYLELERRCLGSYESHIPMAVLDHPEGVLEIHREFARAGAEILQAMAWGVQAIDREAELHRVAVELAREAAGPDRFVAGTLSPFIYSGHPKRELMTKQEAKAARTFFERRVEQQISAGVDLFIVETFYAVDEALLAILFVKDAGVPAVVTLTFADEDHTGDGYSAGGAARILADHGADVVGVNCMRPWETMRRLVKEVRGAVEIPVCAQPTGYELESGETYNRALNVEGLWTTVEPRVVTRFSMADYAFAAQRMGIDLIGSCCGTLPYHVRAMAEAIGKNTDLPDIDRGYQRAGSRLGN